MRALSEPVKGVLAYASPKNRGLGFLLVVLPLHNAAGADKLVGIHSALAISQSLPWIARDAGIFRKHNLDFDLVLMRSASTAAAAMIGGETDVGIIGGIGILSGYVQGAQDFVIVGAVKHILTHSIVAKPEIKWPEDLKGKSIGVNRLAATTIIRHPSSAAYRLGPGEGCDLSPDRRRCRRPDRAAQRLGRRLGDADLRSKRRRPGVSLFESTAPTCAFLRRRGLRLRASVIARKPQVIGQFMRSMAEASKIFHAERETTLKILAKYLRVSDRKVLETSYNNELKAMEQRFDVRPEALQAILDEPAVNDPRAKKVQPQQLIDRRYLDEMEKSGFFDSL